VNAPRLLLAVVAVLLALVLQTAVLTQVSWVSWQGVVPNLVLLVVVAVGLVGGSQTAMTLGFGAGLLLDLAPPADHVAGRWALALVLAGWVAGRVRSESTRPSDLPSLRGPATGRGMGPRAGREGRGAALLHTVATVAGCSFLASSVFAVTGLVLRDPASGVAELFPVVAAGVVLDVAAALVLVPLVGLVLHRRDRSGDPDRRRDRDRVLA